MKNQIWWIVGAGAVGLYFFSKKQQPASNRSPTATAGTAVQPAVLSDFLGQVFGRVPITQTANQQAKNQNTAQTIKAASDAAGGVFGALNRLFGGKGFGGGGGGGGAPASSVPVVARSSAPTPSNGISDAELYDTLKGEGVSADLYSQGYGSFVWPDEFDYGEDLYDWGDTGFDSFEWDSGYDYDYALA